MKRWRQLLSFYLVLCVALAGAVGLSPVLHVMVEHGGQGPSHSHAGFSRNGTVAVAHAHPHQHPHESAPAPSNGSLERRFAEKYPQPKLFGLEPQDIYRAVGGWLARTSQHWPGAPENEDHTHHSLAQMLLSGGVEAGLDAPQLISPSTAFAYTLEIDSTTFVAAGFDPQTASRAPPASA